MPLLGAAITCHLITAAGRAITPTCWPCDSLRQPCCRSARCVISRLKVCAERVAPPGVSIGVLPLELPHKVSAHRGRDVRAPLIDAATA